MKTSPRRVSRELALQGVYQWLEMRRDPDTRIARPRQIYTGATERRYSRKT